MGDDKPSLRDLMDERDRRYTQRFDEQEKALAAALLSNKELTNQANRAARDALEKATAELAEYKQVNNEWRGTVNDWRQATVPRAEYNVKHEALERRVANIEKFRDESAGQKTAKTEDRGQNQWAVGLIVGIIMGIIVLIVTKLWK